MSKIDYQKLREIAEKTKISGEAPVMPFDQRINALNDFMKHFSPDIALALLDERERNLQYIKSRDQENEDIALTVGKPRVELEAAENNLIDSECHVAELEEALRDKQALLEASEKRIAELELREVVLPQCYSMLHRVDFDEPYHTEMVYRQHQVLEALHNAGINVTEAGKGEAS
ncbi:TPA: ead/Ea22-like family protein [Escherichia coli]|nr:ead/Ea22-like family protein [Escherichia coli]